MVMGGSGKEERGIVTEQGRMEFIIGVVLYDVALLDWDSAPV